MNPGTIRTQRTPNPNALKFTLDRRVVEGSGSLSFNDPGSAANDPIAGPLFASWDALTPRVLAALERVFS